MSVGVEGAEADRVGRAPVHTGPSQTAHDNPGQGHPPRSGRGLGGAGRWVGLLLAAGAVISPVAQVWRDGGRSVAPTVTLALLAGCWMAALASGLDARRAGRLVLLALGTVLVVVGRSVTGATPIIIVVLGLALVSQLARSLAAPPPPGEDGRRRAIPPSTLATALLIVLAALVTWYTLRSRLLLFLGAAVGVSALVLTHRWPQVPLAIDVALTRLASRAKTRARRLRMRVRSQRSAAAGRARRARSVIERRVRSVLRRTARAAASVPPALRRGWSSIPPTAVAAGVGLLNMAAAGPALFNALYRPDRWTGPSDYLEHTAAVSISFPNWWQPRVPEFVLHGAIRIFSMAIGTNDFRLGMMIISTMILGGIGALLFYLFLDKMTHWRNGPSTALAAGLSIALTLAESPTALLGWSYLYPPDFFLPFAMAHSPTNSGGRLLAFAYFYVLLDVIMDRDTRFTRWLPVLAVLSTLYNPYLTLSATPVALLWALLHRSDRSGKERIRRVILLGVVPVTVSIILTIISFSYEVRYWSEGKKYARHIVIHPFHDINMMGGLHPLFWTVLAFPIVGILLFRSRLRSVEFDLACGIFALSLVVGVVFSAEGGAYQYSADLLHFVQISIPLLSIVIIRSVLALRPTMTSTDRWRVALLALTFAPYVVAGLGFWTCQGTGVCLAR